MCWNASWQNLLAKSLNRQFDCTCYSKMQALVIFLSIEVFILEIKRLNSPLTFLKIKNLANWLSLIIGNERKIMDTFYNAFRCRKILPLIDRLYLGRLRYKKDLISHVSMQHSLLQVPSPKRPHRCEAIRRWTERNLAIIWLNEYSLARFSVAMVQEMTWCD